MTIQIFSEGFWNLIVIPWFVFTAIIIMFHKSSPHHNEKTISLQSIKSIILSFFSSFGLGVFILPMEAVQQSGPGSIIWMIFGFFLCRQIRYAEAYFSVKYVKSVHNETIGGVFAYFKDNQSILSRIFLGLFVLAFLLGSLDFFQFSKICESTQYFIHIIAKKLNISIIPSYQHFVLSGISVLLVFVFSKNLNTLFFLGSILIPLFFVSYVLIMTEVFSTSGITVFNMLRISVLSFYESWKYFLKYGNYGDLLDQMFYGISTAIYSTNVGLGSCYLIESESKAKDHATHARFSSWDIIPKMIICLVSALGFYSRSYGNKNLDVIKIITDSIPSGLLLCKLITFLCSCMLVSSCITGGLKVFRLMISDSPKVYLWTRLFAAILLSLSSMFLSSAGEGFMVTMVVLGVVIILNLLFIIFHRKQMSS